MSLRGRDKKTEAACQELAARCPILATIVERTGPPKWRSRPAGFPGLARIIIEQQLSVASASAILARVQAISEDLQPEAILDLQDEVLREQGLSRPKIRYLKVLAGDVIEGRFDFADLAKLTDQEASAALEALLGVGRWTAAVYLLFCEGRRDLWPRGDVALLAAHGMAGGDFTRQELKDFDAWTEDFYAPHRGIAAHILWAQIAWSRRQT